MSKRFRAQISYFMVIARALDPSSTMRFFHFRSFVRTSGGWCMTFRNSRAVIRHGFLRRPLRCRFLHFRCNWRSGRGIISRRSRVPLGKNGALFALLCACFPAYGTCMSVNHQTFYELRRANGLFQRFRHPRSTEKPVAAGWSVKE